MSFSLDAEVSEGLDVLAARIGDVAPMAVGDVVSRRTVYEKLQLSIFAQLPSPADVTTKDFQVPTTDGTSVLARWYTKDGSNPGSAVLYIPGGGMISSSVAIYDIPVATYVSATGVPFLSVDYRRAPEVNAPTPVTDCYAALRWLADNAADLGVDPGRLGIMGDSGGGGIAASLAIYARDHDGPAIAKQLLIYPMLDDRNITPDPELVPFAPWTYDDNMTGWTALLGSDRGGPNVDAYGAAGRVESFAGLAPAYVEVGELDIFRDETLALAYGLLSAAVSTELHVHPGVPHAFEAFVPTADVSRRALRDRHRVVSAL